MMGAGVPEGASTMCLPACLCFCMFAARLPACQPSIYLVRRAPVAIVGAVLDGTYG